MKKDKICDFFKKMRQIRANSNHKKSQLKTENKE
jgi:hypothetical protein